MRKNENNYAFIDGQNLHFGTAKRNPDPWQIDLARFRVYLRKKYGVQKAYYFLGYAQDKNRELYEEIQNAGFILTFRQHNQAMLGLKKGNVDSDIIFQIMKKLYSKEDFDKVLLVSGDGDYKLLVDFLIEERRLEKILFPYRRAASSLYRSVGAEHFDSLDALAIREKIEKKKRAP